MRVFSQRYVWFSLSVKESLQHVAIRYDEAGLNDLVPVHGMQGEELRELRLLFEPFRELGYLPVRASLRRSPVIL